jgi:hypothetical protein
MKIVYLVYLLTLWCLSGIQSSFAETSVTVISPQEENDFECTSVGLFPNTNSVDCSDYFICVLRVDGFHRLEEICQRNLIFHWDYRICVPYYLFECPNTIPTTPITTTEVTTPTRTTTEATTRSTTTRTTTEDTTRSTTTRTTTEATTRSTTTRTTTEASTSTTTEATTRSTTTRTTTEDTTRTTTEATTRSTTTRTTTEASTRSTTTEATTRTTTDATTNSTTTRTTTDSTTTSQIPTTTTPAGFLCPQSGNFPDETSLDCRRFRVCTGNGQPPTVGTCGGNTIFNWDRLQCTSSNQFGCAMLADPFDCPSVGDWPNPNSRNCATYFQCFNNWDGTIRHQTGICQGNNIFDWTTRQCRSRNQVACMA